MSPLGWCGFHVFPKGLEWGVDRVERVKPRGYVCIGGLDTNDLDETEDYFDGGVASGYVDDRTGLILDEALAKQAEAEEMEFIQRSNCTVSSIVRSVGRKRATPPSRPSGLG